MLHIDDLKITDDIVVCQTMWSRMRGLMFRKRILNQAYIFVFSKPQRIALHMFWVFFPIDILWLDEQRKVVDLRTNVKPFTPHIVSKEKGLYVIELPSGTIVDKKIQTGQSCQWR